MLNRDLAATLLTKQGAHHWLLVSADATASDLIGGSEENERVEGDGDAGV